MSDALRLRDVADFRATVERLVAAGQREPVAAEKARRFGAGAEALATAGVAEEAPVHAFFVPGRLEVLGKHTDYAGGRSIIAAVERGICLVAAPGDAAAIHAVALDLDDACTFDLAPDLAPTIGHWSNYPMTVARRLARNFPGELRGGAIAYSSDLPVAAGMSSSSTVMVASFLALSAINRLAEREEFRREVRDAESLAEYLGTIENGQSFGGLAGDKGVGTFGGSEDHVAMLCSRPGELAQYAYCPVRRERRIALPAEYVFAVAASGVVAAKTGEAMAKYNRASGLARAVTAAWNRATGRRDPHLAAALASDELEAAAERMRGVLAASGGAEGFPAEELLPRFEHFLTENERVVPAAGDALAAGEVDEFARLADRSQRIAEDLLGNQVAETAFLARSARELGAPAASSFGAGFGGSVWALVPRDEAEAFLPRWSRAYREEHPEPARQAAFFLTRPGTPACALSGQGVSPGPADPPPGEADE